MVSYAGESAAAAITTAPPTKPAQRCSELGSGFLDTQERRPHLLPHRVEDEIDAFSPCEFGSGNKIAVARYKNNLSGEPLCGYRGDVKADAHIDTLLNKIELKIAFGNLAEVDLSPAKRLNRLVL